MNKKGRIIILLGLMTILLACARPDLSRKWQLPTRTPAREGSVEATEHPASKTAAPGKKPEGIELKLWLHPGVPEELARKIQLPEQVKIVRNENEANLQLRAAQGSGNSRWIYALVAPFPSLVDGVTLQEVKDAWTGNPPASFGGHKLWMAASTRAAFTEAWGEASASGVETVDPGTMLDTAWNEQKAGQSPWALVPFEALEPRWKVLRVDGMSPLEKAFDANTYPLAVSFSLRGETSALDALNGIAPVQMLLPATNRDPEKMTVLLMTGTTALVRATGAKMEAKGMTYPAEKIIDWLRSADLRHISNEVSFSDTCPPANPYQTSLQFCSRPEYIELLDYIQPSVIELTGNHNMDWDTAAYLNTLQLYKDRNWPYYAGGNDLAEAMQPVKIEDHGNKLAFLGCNSVGPAIAWAGEYNPGAATCDAEKFHAEIQVLRQEGYLPIFTFQSSEYYTPEPRPEQKVDFEGMAEAGAVIVSGSQAHKPQGFGFYKDSLIHYGLGNLFFDQMDLPVVGTRWEFLDRHVFYDGRYIGTEVLTAMLEDYSQPRPMTPEERKALLQDTFSSSDW